MCVCVPVPFHSFNRGIIARRHEVILLDDRAGWGSRPQTAVSDRQRLEPSPFQRSMSARV